MADCPDILLSCAQMRRLGLRLPKLLERLEAALGPDAMHRLVVAYGGRSLHVAKASDQSRTILARRCGNDVADWFQSEIGHGSMMIPLGPASTRVRTLANCIAGLRDGETQREITGRTGIPARSITRITADLRKRRIDPNTFFTETDPA